MINNRFNVVYHLLGFVINLFYLWKKIEYETQRPIFGRDRIKEVG
jgi:hypothetical protein